MAVEPRPEHFDKRITVTTPLQRPGAYLLRAKMAGGNTSFIVVWVDDTAIVQETAGRQDLLLRGRRRHRQTLPKANVEFFGWQQVLSRQSAAA